MGANTETTYRALDIVRALKAEFVNIANHLAPDGPDLPPDLAFRSYAEILSTAATAKGIDINGITVIIDSVRERVGDFSQDKEVHDMYHEIFFPVYFAANNCRVDRKLLEEERYFILPAGRRPNDGRFMGAMALRKVPRVPDFLEVTFATENLSASTIGDILEAMDEGINGGYILNPIYYELPMAIKAYAKNHESLPPELGLSQDLADYFKANHPPPLFCSNSYCSGR